MRTLNYNVVKYRIAQEFEALISIQRRDVAWVGHCLDQECLCLENVANRLFQRLIHRRKNHILRLGCFKQHISGGLEVLELTFPKKQGYALSGLLQSSINVRDTNDRLNDIGKSLGWHLPLLFSMDRALEQV